MDDAGGKMKFDYYEIMPEWTTKHSPFDMGYNYAHYFRAPHTFVRDLYNQVKWFIQRGQRGYADCDIWSLDFYLSKWMPAALKRLETNNIGHPFGMTRRGWNTRLRIMREGFEAAHEIGDKMPDRHELNRLERKMNKGLKMFAKHFLSLWD